MLPTGTLVAHAAAVTALGHESEAGGGVHHLAFLAVTGG